MAHRYIRSFLAVAVFQNAAAADIADLPVSAMPNSPALLLELGTSPPPLAVHQTGLNTIRGELAGQEPGITSQMETDSLVSRHPGFGAWSTSFRFPLETNPLAGPYTFYARWRQGGDPAVCEQTFALWAGPDKEHLQFRAEYKLKPKGWDYAWVAAEPPFNLQPGDAVIEIRDSGAGHDAKVFDAFLLGPPPAPAGLPVSPTKEKPVFLLELGKSAKWATAAKPEGLEVLIGSLHAHDGSGGAVEEKDEIQILHPGYGQWGASFRFKLEFPPPPGHYRFHARYKSGGEISQVTQTFTIKAGSKLESLANRANFTLTNTTPWEYRWLTGKGTVPVFPGDRLIEIENAGKADAAKVFDAFLLQLDTPLQGAMTAQDAELRYRFLATIKQVSRADRHLYVLDKLATSSQALFAGLTDKSTLPLFEKMQVTYLMGEDAERMARSLNLPALPAALVRDAQYSLLGGLYEPKTIAEVTRFLTDPQKHGKQPAIPSTADEPTRPLRNGIPEAWLVGGLQDGIAGVSIYGMDAETVLRPNPGQSYPSTEMMGGRMREWRKASTTEDGKAIVSESTDHDSRWSGNTGYAQLYLHTDQATQAKLPLDFAGTASAWLDGQEAALDKDPGLTLSAGWHSLLLKLVTHLDKDQAFAFTARFTDPAGQPIGNIQTRLSDPAADLALNRLAARLRPLVYLESPANLAHPGDPLKLRLDVRWHPLEQEKELDAPLPRFPANLRVEIRAYDGKTIAVREQTGVFPSLVNIDLGKAPGAGYYAVYPSLYHPDGRLIMAFPPDGFSVIGGSLAQRERLPHKKLWNNFYYAFSEGDRSFQQPSGYFDWLERMGILQSYGSYPGFQPSHQALWNQVRKRRLNVFADTGGDSHWLNDTTESVRDYIAKTALYTRYFKANNEIDTRHESEWAKLRSPAHWVERAKREHDLVHQVRPDGHYVGGSLVKPGDTADNAGYPDNLGPGLWFEQVLKLGLDKHLDAWDVHAYPQKPPRFDGPIGNSEAEDERGVLATYARIGRSNVLPFWLGEAGAKAAHGSTGRRWQAEQVAKMIAWVVSRADYLGIAFCLGHEYDLGQGRLWDYSMGHKPAEAALYTAGALIDGLPFRKAENQAPQIQAAWYGPTLMAWRTDGNKGSWQSKLNDSQKWVLVDVVGHAAPLEVSVDGTFRVELGSSPVYVLPESDYRKLLGNR